MKKKSVKFFLVIIVLLNLICLYSCGSEGDVKPDAVSFTLLGSCKTDNDTIDIYELTDINDVYYRYEKISRPVCESWICNYMYVYDYIVDNSDFPSEIFDVVKDTIISSLNQYENILGLEFNYHEDGYVEEKEVNVDNEIIKLGLQDKEEEIKETLLIDLYIPYKLLYKNSPKNYIVMIPVYTFFAFKINEELKFNNQTYNYNSFFNQSNVLKK